MLTIKNNASHIVEKTNEKEHVRLSSLPEPNIQLIGHKSFVYTLNFSSDGKYLLSAGRDRKIFIWDLFSDEIINSTILQGPKADILRALWSYDSLYIQCASADGRVRVYDTETNKCIKSYFHEDVVNDISTNDSGPYMILSVSDDRYAELWDTRTKDSCCELKFPYQLTCCELSKDSRIAFVSGIDQTIYAFDTRNSKALFTMQGHTNIVTDISLSHDETQLISNSMDQSILLWDARLLSSKETVDTTNGSVRCIGKYYGHIHHQQSSQLLRCSFSTDDSKLSAGSSDSFVNIWDKKTYQILYKLPGHKGSVNDVVFHPNEPIIASCSNDMTILVGEILL